MSNTVYERVLRRPDYDRIAVIAGDIVHSVLLEGERNGYGASGIDIICGKPDNLTHAATNLADHSAGLTDERHLEHAITRCVMEWIKLHRQADEPATKEAL